MPRTGSIADVLAEVNKKYDINIGAASTVIEETQFLPTGNLAIDYVAAGGIPLGRTTELYGAPSSGKTTTALQTAAALQRRIIEHGGDEYILYLDFEHALDPDYCAALGLDVNHPSFLTAQPHSMEQGAEAALKLIRTGAVRLSIWDSVAAMAPIARMEGEFDQRTAAMNKARLMSGLMLQLTPLLHKNNSAAVFINHLMESVEMNARPGMPPKVTTPGGKALKFYASLRVEFRQMGNTKAKARDTLTGELTNQSVATLTKIKCVKNKVGTPFREAEARITYGHGFDNTWSALQVLLAHKTIRKDGAWYRFKAPLTHEHMLKDSLHGEANVLLFARDHPDWAQFLVEKALEVVADYGPDGLETGDGSDPDTDLTDDEDLT